MGPPKPWFKPINGPCITEYPVRLHWGFGTDELSDDNWKKRDPTRFSGWFTLLGRTVNLRAVGAEAAPHVRIFGWAGDQMMPTEWP